MGGPINVWFDDCHNERLGSIVPETPPHQMLEELRDMPIREEEQQEYG